MRDERARLLAIAPRSLRQGLSLAQVEREVHRMSYTDKKKASNRKWDSANLDRLSYTVPKGQKAAIQAAAEQAGESVNQFTQGALLARMGLQTWPVKEG